MPGGSKKGGGLEVKSAYKMKYNKSSFPFKTDLDDGFGDVPRKNTEGAPVDTSKSKSEKPGPGYSWVHRYWKKGTSNTVPHSGTGPGAGDLMPGYPRWEKIKD